MTEDPVPAPRGLRQLITVVDGELHVRVLGTQECIDLVRDRHLGRLALTNRALPVILPVLFGWLDDRPTMLAGGLVARAAAKRSVACFEVDEATPTSPWSWSVALVGRLILLEGGHDLERAHSLGLPRWSDAARWVAIEPDLVSGRRVDRVTA